MPKNRIYQTDHVYVLVTFERRCLTVEELSMSVCFYQIVFVKQL